MNTEGQGTAETRGLQGKTGVSLTSTAGEIKRRAHVVGQVREVLDNLEGEATTVRLSDLGIDVTM